MTYTIVTDPHPDEPRGSTYDAVIGIVGCGGTGGFLAEAVCRLLIGKRAELFLIDHDRVEEHNCMRQAFNREDVGKFKSQILAERLSRRYRRNVGYSVYPFDWELHGACWTSLSTRLPLIIGCVDNAAARSAIAQAMRDARPEPIDYSDRSERCHPWWVDLGNERNAGQVLVGNLIRPEHLAHTFQYQAQRVLGLPAPSVQRPDLLLAPPRKEPAPDCAEAVATGSQGPTINQVMAAIGAAFVEKLLAGTCTWMQALINMDDGVFARVSADPKLIAQLTGVHVNKLVYRYDEAERLAREADAQRGTLMRSLGHDSANNQAREAAHARAERAALDEAIQDAPPDERVDRAFLEALEHAQREAAVAQ